VAISPSTLNPLFVLVAVLFTSFMLWLTVLAVLLTSSTPSNVINTFVAIISPVSVVQPFVPRLS
jgi:hypothetical protein